ncbi:MAG: hypothetical protein K2X99_00920 [Gemmatimonadaceae bacterium]|nr:hypothetical protein [Gemmatimonadaceae bacterium]
MRSWITRLFVLALAVGTAAGAQDAPKKKKGDRNRLTTDDIAEVTSVATNAYDVVNQLRPQWLRPPVGLTASSNAGGEGGGAKSIVVYIDDMRQQGLDDLRTVRFSVLAELRYLDQNRALIMRGPGHEAGAIEVTTINKKK